MIKFKITGKSLVLIACLAVVAACASKLDTYSTNTEASPQIGSAETKLQESQKNQANVFAPVTYAKAIAALNEAKAERSDNGSNVKILKAIELTNSLTLEANRKSEIARTSLPGVAEARLAAMDVKANESAAKEFKKADEELVDYTSDVESGKIKNSTKTATSLVSKYQALELQGTLGIKLGKTVSLIELAKNEGASENAPKSLARTIKYYETAAATIRKNPHNNSEIDPVAGEAQFEAEKLLRVTRKAKAAGGAKSEDVVVQAESQQQYIYAQTQQLADAKNEKQVIQAEVKDLKSIKDLQDKVAAISRKFTSSEADVYQQGKSVILRLKGIQFPNNKTEIPSTSFATLKKVQESIEAFDSPHVRIEGHTDSLGDKKLNLPLSQKRAESVRKYMSANLDLNSAIVQTEGFGSSKPISSNKTSEGRAQNRRIDVVIE
jgi:OOP family OmpA-OmpF porin